MGAINTTPDNSDYDSVSSYNDHTIDITYNNETRSYASNGTSDAFNVGTASSPLTPSLIQGGGSADGCHSRWALTRPTGTDDTPFTEERATQEEDGLQGPSAKITRRMMDERMKEE
jgi:hypothetical protein